MKRAAVVACLVLLVAGCSDSESREAEKPVPGGTFVEAVVRPASLDPALASTVSERVIADQLYDGLTTWNPRTQAAEPALAQSWKPSDDRKQWTFNLREATAGNNERVTAADVKATLQKIARKSQGSPSADFLSLVAGFKEFSVNDAVTELAGVVAVDERTVRIDLEQPFAELPKLLGNPTFGIVHRSGDGATHTTGPMMIDDATDPNTLRMKKSPNSDALVDRVDARYYQDVAGAYAALERSEVQWAPVPPEKADEAGSKYGRHLYRPSLRTLFLSMNLANPKLSDVRFREAIVHAIDRNAVRAKLGIGDVRPLNGVVPDGVPAAQNGGCATRCNFDEAKARDLLAQVFPQGPPPLITIDVAQGPPLTEPPMRQIIDDLARVGIVATSQPTPSEQYSARTVADNREIFQTSWSAAYPSPDAFLTPLFLSTSISNVSLLKDPKVDTALANAQTAVDVYAREQQFQEAERRVMEAMPLIPIAQFPVTSAATSVVRGIDPLPTGNFDISDVWLTNSPR